MSRSMSLDRGRDLERRAPGETTAAYFSRVGVSATAVSVARSQLRFAAATRESRTFAGGLSSKCLRPSCVNTAASIGLILHNGR